MDEDVRKIAQALYIKAAYGANIHKQNDSALAKRC